MDAPAPGLALELAADVAVHQRVEDEAGPPLYIVEHPVEMAFGTDHRPEMAEHVDALELGEAGLGDHLQRLAGRIRQEVEVERIAHSSGSGPCLWINMGNSLA